MFRNTNLLKSKRKSKNIDNQAAIEEVKELDILEGTAYLWIERGFDYSKHRYLPLESAYDKHDTNMGIHLNITEENRLEFIHAGDKTIRLLGNVSKLDKCSKHMIACTWDVCKNHYCLYIDDAILISEFKEDMHYHNFALAADEIAKDYRLMKF